jgi:hypothetical protein
MMMMIMTVTVIRYSWKEPVNDDESMSNLFESRSGILSRFRVWTPDLLRRQCSQSGAVNKQANLLLPPCRRSSLLPPAASQAEERSGS